MCGCSPSKKYFGKGMYDAAVKASVKKLRKNSGNKKNILILEKAYPLAKEQDMERISFLKKEGRPDIWDEVFNHYTAMKVRQELVKTVIPLNVDGRTVTFPVVDFDAEMINAKKNAAEYFYVHASKLMETNNKSDIRQAYNEFKQVKAYYPSYQDVDAKISKARELGISWVFVSVENLSPYKLSPEFLKELININLPQYNSEWVHYTDQNIYKNVDYYTKIKFKTIDVSPERIKEEQNIETKEIQDGWDYYLDSKGNVMKDSLGNDIKKPKYKTITCKITRTFQSKAALVHGTVDYIEASTNQVLKSVPVVAENKFDHTWAVATGDLNALSENSKKLLSSKPLPFPTDGDMMSQASATLKSVISKAFSDNKYFLK
jgi:hypothetical protein